MTLILFFAILLTPLAFIIGVILWLIGVIQKKDGALDTPMQILGKKIMWFSFLAFLIGIGSCWGLIGLGSLIGYLSNIFN